MVLLSVDLEQSSELKAHYNLDKLPLIYSIRKMKPEKKLEGYQYKDNESKLRAEIDEYKRLIRDMERGAEREVKPSKGSSESNKFRSLGDKISNRFSSFLSKADRF